MARIANFTSAGVPTGGSDMTLDALMQRARLIAQQQQQTAEPRQMQSPWQGAALLGETLSNKLQQGRVDRQLGESRETLAKIRAGIDLEQGPTPEQISQASVIDPEYADRLTALAAQVVQARRAREQQLADRDEGRAYEQGLTTSNRAYEQSDQIADEQRAAAAKAAEETRKTAASALKIVTGDDAAALGGDPKRQYRVSADGTTLEDITPKEEAPLSPEGKIEFDFRKGAYGDPASPAAAAQRDAALKRLATAGRNPLSSFTQKQLVEDEDTIMSLEATVEKLGSILQPTADNPVPLNERAGSGALAGLQSWAARNDPTGFFDDKKGAATTDLNVKVMGAALSSLKAIFGGNPTEGERAVLLNLQGAADKSPEERKAIIEDAISVAQDKMNRLQRRRSQMSGGDYYGGGGDVPTPQTQEEFDALPPGTRFIDPDDGMEYTK